MPLLYRHYVIQSCCSEPSDTRAYRCRMRPTAVSANAVSPLWPSLLQPKTDLQGDLKMDDAIPLDMPALLDHFEPVEIIEAARRFLDGIADGVVAALLRTADDFDDFVG